MSEFTPGPWIIKGPSKGDNSGRDDGGDYAIIADNQIIAEAIHQTDKTIYQPAFANARLIASAPDLLETLKRILLDSDNPDNFACESDQQECIRNRATQAIAQAEGEPHATKST